MQLFLLEQRLNDVPSRDDWLTPGERLFLQRLQFPKRRSDWRLGRWTAKCAVLSYPGCRKSKLDAIEIRTLPTGAPQVLLSDTARAPSISISHCAGVGLCAVGPPGAPVGCDLERSEPRSEHFLQTFFTDDELNVLSVLLDDQKSLLANIIWSAKESCLKYTGEGLSRDTREVQVTVQSFIEKTTLSSTAARNWLPLVMTVDAKQINGYARLWDGFVETIAGSAALPTLLSAAVRLALEFPSG